MEEHRPQEQLDPSERPAQSDNERAMREVRGMIPAEDQSADVLKGVLPVLAILVGAVLVLGLIGFLFLYLIT